MGRTDEAIWLDSLLLLIDNNEKIEDEDINTFVYLCKILNKDYQEELGNYLNDVKILNKETLSKLTRNILKENFPNEVGSVEYTDNETYKKLSPLEQSGIDKLKYMLESV